MAQLFFRAHCSARLGMMRLALLSCVPLVLAEEAQLPVPQVPQVPLMLRGSKASRSLSELESCVSKPNFDRAQASWCGQQREPVACFKDASNLNPIWDCHLQSLQVETGCSLGAKPCAWPTDALAVAAPGRKTSSGQAQGEPTRFVTWNLYVFTLAGRIHPVVDELMRMQPEIAAIPEMWHEKHAILDRLNQVSGNVYAFATGGSTEQFNDADILFRADKWEHIASDLVPFSAGRAVNWAALRRKSDGYTLIAAGRAPYYAASCSSELFFSFCGIFVHFLCELQKYPALVLISCVCGMAFRNESLRLSLFYCAGTHPLCCQGDYVVMEAVDFVIRTLSDWPARIALAA